MNVPCLLQCSSFGSVQVLSEMKRIGQHRRKEFKASTGVEYIVYKRITKLENYKRKRGLNGAVPISAILSIAALVVGGDQVIVAAGVELAPVFEACIPGLGGEPVLVEGRIRDEA